MNRQHCYPYTDLAKILILRYNPLFENLPILALLENKELLFSKQPLILPFSAINQQPCVKLTHTRSQTLS